MNFFTRRQFLERASTGAAGALGAGAVTGCSIGSQGARQSSEPLKILSLGDMHLVDSKTAEYPRKVVQAMNSEGGDLVLVCGDLGTNGKRAELELARSTLNELKMPYYPVLGNHDALYSGEQEEKLFKEIFNLKQSSYHFVKNGIHFFGLDHGCGKNMGKNQVRAQTMNWIKTKLAEIPENQPIIIFSHYPFAKGIKYRTANADAVQALFKDRKLLAIISGHFHGNTERIESGVLMTTTACSSGSRGNHDRTKAKGYRVFRIDAERNITTEFKEVIP